MSRPTIASAADVRAEIAARQHQLFREDPAAYWEQLLADLQAEDPGDRAAKLGPHIHAAQQYVQYLADLRDEAVVQMRARGDSLETVARCLGVDKSRAQQIVDRIRRKQRECSDV